MLAPACGHGCCSHSHAGPSKALEPRRGSQLRGLRVQPVADSATATEPWVWECERCDRCSVIGEVVAPPAKAEPAYPLCASCKGCTHSLELLNLTASATPRVYSAFCTCAVLTPACTQVVVPGASKGGVITLRPGNTGASVFEAFGAWRSAACARVWGRTAHESLPWQMSRGNTLGW